MRSRVVLNKATGREEIKAFLRMSSGLDLKEYDPAASAKKLGIPMLILQGERDYQVTMTDFDFNPIVPDDAFTLEIPKGYTVQHLSLNLSEVDNGEKEIADAEDRLLEQMVAGEQYERQIKESEKVVKAAEDVAKVERAKIEGEKKEAEQELAQLNAERERAATEIPESMMDHYDRIMKKHDNLALAEIREEKCSACGMRMRPQVIQAIRRSTTDEMFHCETCTRILYYTEPTAAAAVANAQPAPPAPNSTSTHREN